MRIDSGYIGMESARLYKSSSTMRQGIESGVSGNTMTGGQLTSFFEQFTANNEKPKSGKFPEEIKDTDNNEKSGVFNPLENSWSLLNSPIHRNTSRVKLRTDTTNQFQKMHQEFVKNLLQLFFGRRPDKNKAQAENQTTYADVPSSYQFVTNTEYTSFSYEESEFTSFQAVGNVHTADGRDININLNISMSSRFMSTYSESVTTASYQLTDPLVINLEDAPANLSDMSFFFDLDCDGSKEEISVLSGQSGFLALDKNNDGIINDGSELFGTKSGDGFKDLSAYDEDHNGWIDENDAIFDMLKIWVKDSEGNDFLYSLKDKNVGAICLESANTEFSLHNEAHDTTGVIRKTGIFLYETGSVGTLQHLDMAFDRVG